MMDFKCRPICLCEVRIFSVSENGENGLGDEGADGGMPPPRIFVLESPLHAWLSGSMDLLVES